MKARSNVCLAPRGDEALGQIREWSDARDLVFRHEAETGFGAVFSPCGAWRYLLWRIGDRRAKLCGMGLLNPSTADHRGDDPTIRQCRARARQARLGGVLVWNLFAFRATLPADLKRAPDPVGPENDAAIALSLGMCARTIVGWGNHGAHLERDRAVLALCEGMDTRFDVLGITGAGQPRHPLYLASSTRLKRWKPHG
ncbi:MAG: DUF1643 domain-containing protein [Novosphingobium sp.]|nr:DUF1643 domain-containing protein [Novosphingobium sp.]